MGSKEELCMKLDKVLLEFFDTLSQLYVEQDKLDKFLKSGFLNMSRARYSMGIRNVGIEQCDNNKMKATVKVSISDDQQFTLDYGEGCDLENDFNDLDIKSGDSKKNVRRRKVGTDSSDKERDMKDKIEEVPMEEIKKNKSSLMYDPLKWFGVLVPPALRQSQSDFKCSAQTVISIASLKAKVASLQDEYTLLLTKKAKFDDS